LQRSIPDFQALYDQSKKVVLIDDGGLLRNPIRQYKVPVFHPCRKRTRSMDIQFLPSPPTDNLYKFMAIFGAWALLILALFVMSIGYISFKSREESQQAIAYTRSVGTVLHIQDRLDAIQAGRLNDAIVTWSPIQDGSDTEKAFLRKALQNNKEYLARHQGDAERHDAWTFWQILEATHGIVFILIFGGVGIFCFIYGFRRWYKRVQRVSDAILLGKQTLQELTNQKLKRDLEAATQTPQLSPPTP
jgi:hypothetical protein